MGLNREELSGMATEKIKRKNEKTKKGDMEAMTLCTKQTAGEMEIAQGSGEDDQEKHIQGGCSAGREVKARGKNVPAEVEQ